LSATYERRPARSICHIYGSTSRATDLLPVHIIRLFTQYWRNDYLGVERYSSFRDDEQKLFTLAALKRQHEEFARLWDRNLQAQGYYEAFLRTLTR
jgi:hypothetical protein